MAPLTCCAVSFVRLIHPGRPLLFALLGVADLVLTYALVHFSRGQIYEGNPVAAWCLSQYGWLGMAVYKAVLVLGVASLAAVIARQSPRTARRVLILGCAITSVVLLYSCYLGFACAEPIVILHDEQEQSVQLDDEIARIAEYNRRHKWLADEMLAGRCSLRRAVDELELSARGMSERWLATFRDRQGDRSLREGVAVDLVSACLAQREQQPEAARGLALRLSRAFRRLFRLPLPDCCKRFLPPTSVGEASDGPSCRSRLPRLSLSH